MNKGHIHAQKSKLSEKTEKMKKNQPTQTWHFFRNQQIFRQCWRLWWVIPRFWRASTRLWRAPLFKVNVILRYFSIVSAYVSLLILLKSLIHYNLLWLISLSKVFVSAFWGEKWRCIYGDLKVVTIMRSNMYWWWCWWLIGEERKVKTD